MSQVTISLKVISTRYKAASQTPQSNTVCKKVSKTSDAIFNIPLHELPSNNDGSSNTTRDK